MADKASVAAAYAAWVTEVQAIGTAPPPPPPVGVRIRVIAPAKVRATPVQADPGMGSQPVGVLGTVKAGTVVTNGYWFIDFDAVQVAPAPPALPAALHGWVYPSNFAVI